MDAVENINSAILGEVVISGANEEQDDALRCRYFNSFEKESFGGTVKLRLLDSDNNIPSSELLELVQTAGFYLQTGDIIINNQLNLIIEHLGIS